MWCVLYGANRYAKVRKKVRNSQFLRRTKPIVRNPSASYEALGEHLKTIVEWELSVSRDDLSDPES